MECPKCGTQYSAGMETCPICRAPLPNPEMELEPVFLLRFEDQRELAMAREILNRANIPSLWREVNGGRYVRALCGDHHDGTDLYVDRRYTHRALRLLRQFDHETEEPFDEGALNDAIDEYMAENPEEMEPSDDEAASPEGYRMVWIFLAIFAALALVPLIRSLFYG